MTKYRKAFDCATANVVRAAGFALAGAMVLSAGACDGGADSDLARRLADMNSQMVETKRENTRLEAEVKNLKMMVAQAKADPGSIVLKDPEIIELIASIRAESGRPVTIGEGDLDPQAASRIVMKGAQALQQCYERALKMNSSLQYQSGLHLVLGITVDTSGLVKAVTVTPSVDAGLTTCIDGAASRWKFPKFTGEAVTIEQKIKLTPKT